MLYPLILLLSLLASPLLAAPDGEVLFGRHCSACHGERGEGGVGVPLSLSSFINSVPDEYLWSSIRLGRPGRIMPAFDRLSDAQIDAVVAYMRSWTDQPAPAIDHQRVVGDAKNGEKLYRRNCSRCHGRDGKGGTGTGVTFSRKRELPVIAPALNNSGFLASATDNLIKDAILFGREGTPMTSALVDGLSEADVDDLVAFIRAYEQTPAAPAEQLAADESAIILESPYSLEETVDNIKQAIADQNFTLIRTDYLDYGLVEEGEENRKQVVFHFCNFKFLFDALAIDPRIGIFLPCRINAIEREGKVEVSSINPMRLSALFNNYELDQACEKMSEIYIAIMEDAVL